MKYIDLLNQTAEETTKQSNQLIAEEASLNLQHEIFSVKKALATNANYINILKQNKSLNFNAIITAMNDRDLLNRKYGQLVELQNELF